MKALQYLQVTKAIAAAGTPERLTASSTIVESAEIYARKDPATANTGNVFIGFSSTGGQNYRVLEPGDSFTISSDEANDLDLSLIYVDAANNDDAVVVTALK
jgi:phosphoheptose isomerase